MEIDFSTLPDAPPKGYEITIAIVNADDTDFKDALRAPDVTDLGCLLMTVKDMLPSGYETELKEAEKNW
jgi:hypothetical protein